MGPVLSAKAYVSVLNPAPLATGVVPLRLVGLPPVPVAVRVQAEVAAVPPPLLITVLINVNDGCVSLLLMVQLAVSPSARVIVFPRTAPPPFLTQLYKLAVYPVGPVSPSVYVSVLNVAP